MSYCLCPTILESCGTKKSITNSAKVINTIIGQSVKIYIDSYGNLLNEYKNIKNIDNIIYEYFINYVENQIEDMNYDLVKPISDVIKNYTKFHELLLDLSKKSTGPIILSDKSNYNGFVLTGCFIHEPKEFLASISGNTTYIGTVNGPVHTNTSNSTLQK